MRQQNVFYDILERKTSFYAIKTRISKGRKINIFPKGFGPKMAIFETFFFLGNIGRKNVFYDILQRKNAFLGYKNKKFKKSKSRHFSKRVNPWFWCKNGHISNYFFLGTIGQKMSFTIFQNGKKPFKAIKKRSSKSRKIDIFPKGITHRFGPQMAIFSNLFFRKYRLAKCLLRYSTTKKNAFLGYKNKKFKQSKT